MAEERLKAWETLFQRALLLIDSVSAAGGILDEWTFGGGTVLMRRHRIVSVKTLISSSATLNAWVT